MPSYLGVYKGAASSRDAKIVRAVNSILGQVYETWELIVIADGCDLTARIMQDNFDDPRISGYKIQKQPLWSGTPRNYGLSKAKGEYACYLDIDDVFGKEHLAEIVPHMEGHDWAYFNDWQYKNGGFLPRPCNINTMGHCGTSNLIHKPDFAKWNHNDGYAHDWNFIRNLKKRSGKFDRITGGRYYVCHIPGKYDL